MYELRSAKAELRAEYIARRRAIPAEERMARNARICRQFLSLVTYRYAETLLLYAPRTDEIDVMPLAARAWKDGKQVAFPRCTDSQGIMQFHTVTSPSQLTEGRFHLLEPDASLPVYHGTDSRQSPAVCIVPALSYDVDGYRLGYGGGYYDRYLSARKITCVGFAYSEFLAERLPRGRFDVAVDILITEKGVKILHGGK